MNPIPRVLRAVDLFQRRTPGLNFGYAVLKKFGQDSAGSLAALVAYYGFLSLFPLLLVLITVLGLVATPSVQHSVLHSALAQFPIVGNQLTGPRGIHSLRAGSVVGLIIGLIGLVWGSQGICSAAQNAMAGVWNVPQVDRPGYLQRLGRSVEFLAVLLLDVVITTVLAGIATFGGTAWYVRVASGVITFVVDIALYVLAFRVLTPKTIGTRGLVPGASVAGIAWAILQYVGTFLVGHQLKHSSQVYGYFGSILGLLAFLYLAAEITLYAAEGNVVWQRRLFPRALQPPLTPADRSALADLAREGERRRGDEIHVHLEEGVSGPQEGAGGVPDGQAPATGERDPSTRAQQPGRTG
ncbi:MAG: YihY/virulence factor BrkB family protein [Acidimicrobiales bacterium]